MLQRWDVGWEFERRFGDERVAIPCWLVKDLQLQEGGY